MINQRNRSLVKICIKLDDPTRSRLQLRSRMEFMISHQTTLRKQRPKLFRAFSEGLKPHSLHYHFSEDKSFSEEARKNERTTGISLSGTRSVDSVVDYTTRHRKLNRRPRSWYSAPPLPNIKVQITPVYFQYFPGRFWFLGRFRRVGGRVSFGGCARGIR